MNKRLLIVNQCSNSLAVEIANAFVRSKKYTEVAIAAGNTINPLYKLDEAVHVIKIKRYNKKSIFTRLISWVIATIQVIGLCWFKYRKYELFLVSNPPTVAFIPLFIWNKYSVLIYDIYPNGLADSGLITRSNFIYKLWGKRNKGFFRNAQHVFTITEGMADTLATYCPKERIEVVELWSNPHLKVLNISKKENPFRQTYKLEDKFVVMYSGNMGRGHDLDKLVDVALLLTKHTQIVFVLVGDGFLKPIIEDKVSRYNLTNILLLPFQDLEMLPYSLACPDVAVVSTNKESGKVCIPSKVFDSLKLGKPILSIAEHDSEIARLVKRYNVGRNYSTDEIQGIAEFILALSNNDSVLHKYELAALEAAKKHTNKLANKFIK